MTGGRDDHVRRTRSLSRRALGGGRDSGRIYRLRPCRAHPRRAGREPSRAAGRRRGVPGDRHLDHAFRRHAGRGDSGRCRLSRASDHHLVPDLRAGGRHIAVLRQRRRTIAAARDLLGGPARGGHRQHALCRHPRPGRQFRHRARRRDGGALGGDCDRRSLWRPARVSRPAGRHPVDRKLDRVRRRGFGHALHRHGRHAFCSAVRSLRMHHLGRVWPRRSKCFRWWWRCSAS